MKVCFRIVLLLAMRANLVEPSLTNAQKVVAGAILSHFNENTGGCNLGTNRIASLLVVRRATVFRATDTTGRNICLKPPHYQNRALSLAVARYSR